MIGDEQRGGDWRGEENIGSKVQGGRNELGVGSVKWNRGITKLDDRRKTKPRYTKEKTKAKESLARKRSRISGELMI